MGYVVGVKQFTKKKKKKIVAGLAQRLSSRETESVTLVETLDETVCVSLGTAKGINTSVAKSRFGNQSRRRKTEIISAQCRLKKSSGVISYGAKAG